MSKPAPQSPRQQESLHEMRNVREHFQQPARMFNKQMDY